MKRERQPEVKSSDELKAAPTKDFMEATGDPAVYALPDGMDPFDWAREYHRKHPWRDEFRIVRLTDFSIPAEAHTDHSTSA